MENSRPDSEMQNNRVPISNGIECEVSHRAILHLAGHSHFRCHMNYLEIEFSNDVLTVKGKLPSFYLKQLLQTILREVPGVKQIDNRVYVASSTGLSSARGPYSGGMRT